MYYDIVNLCPRVDISMGSHAFAIKLYPGFKDMVAARNLNQKSVNTAIEHMGRCWLDACGYDSIFDPDNCGGDQDKNIPPGPNARPLYRPNQGLRVSWGDWGPEHITVPGNACGLDLDDSFSAPKGGRVLQPHNVDSWSQKQLLLITFCWFAENMSLHLEVEADKEARE